MVYNICLTSKAPYKACSAFTHVAACTLALSPSRDTLTRGFSHFVTSMTAPVASGWSGCRVGFAPTGKRRLSTAHGDAGHVSDIVKPVLVSSGPEDFHLRALPEPYVKLSIHTA